MKLLGQWGPNYCEMIISGPPFRIVNGEPMQPACEIVTISKH